MPMCSALVTASRSSKKNWRRLVPSTAQLQVARDFPAPEQTAAVSEPAAKSQQCIPVDQRTEQWMVEIAVRVPVSRTELCVLQEVRSDETGAREGRR